MTADQFLAYFDSRRFIQELRARTKDGALAEITRVLADDGDVQDYALLLEMIRRRESLGSTGLGKGVAVPHGRSTAATRTKVVFARSSRGLDFNAPDGEPCRIFFLIVAPYEDRRHEYLPLLGKIVETVSTEEARDRLLKVVDYGEFAAAMREAFRE